MFLVISNTTEFPIQAPGVSGSKDSRGKAIDHIIQSMHDDFELNADGKTEYSTHLPDRDDHIETEAEIRKALESYNSIIVDHMDYDARYTIVEV